MTDAVDSRTELFTMLFGDEIKDMPREVAQEEARRHTQHVVIALERIAALKNAESNLLERYPRDEHDTIKQFFTRRIEHITQEEW